jgi:cytochrome c-type biogenesis protein CcmH/NrfG
LRLRPQDAAALFDLGFVRERQGKQRAANEAFARAVTFKPSIDRAWYGMGRAHAALSEP